MKAIQTLGVPALLLLAASHCLAAVMNWQSSSGLLPQHTWPAWEQVLGGSPTPAATLVADTLELDSSSSNAWSPYLYYQQSGPILAFSGTFTIEARMRPVTSVFVGTTYCPCTITWASGGGVGNALGFGPGKIFLWKPGNTFDTQVEVDTASFHTYRIEVDGTTAGSAIRVYQDGVLKLNGTTYSDASWWGTTPRIYWGDGTGQGYSKSEWQSLKHSVAAPLPVKNGKILFGCVGKYFSAFSTTDGQAKTIFADPNVPPSPFNQVYQLTAQPGTGLFYGLIQPQVGAVQKSKLLRVDPFTGQSVDVGFIQTADGVIQYVEGMAFNPLTGELYGSMHVNGDPTYSSPNLILIDPNTGVATRIGSLPAGATKDNDIDSLAFSSDGTMYGIDSHAINFDWGTYMYRMQQTFPGVWNVSHQATQLGKLFFGFAYSQEEGVFYCTDPDNRKLFRVTTGMASTELGVIHPSITCYGLAFATPVERSPLVAGLASGKLSVRCPSLTGLTYQLWSSPDLAQWQPFGSPVDGIGSTLDWSIPVEPEPAKFIRAQVVDSP